jgi:hypothetical protein
LHITNETATLFYKEMTDNQSKPVGYSSLEDRKLAGAHYTPKILGDFVAKEIWKAWSCKSNPDEIRILDPALGDGELLLSILEQFPRSSYQAIKVFGFDTDPHAIRVANDRIKQSFPRISLSLSKENFLEFALKFEERDLFGMGAPDPFDLIISNPPYVRTQLMGLPNVRKLSRQFGLSGRFDLYHAFIHGIALVLRPGGIAGIIVSNRFMTTKSGVSIRKIILDKFNVLHVWDLGDTKLFEAAVLPAVLLVKREDHDTNVSIPKFSSIYSCECSSSGKKCLDVISALKENGVVRIKENGQCYRVQHGKLGYGSIPTEVWHIAIEESDKWLNTVKSHTFCTFGDVGKIRVGVKTTADKVFIRSDWNDIPEEDRPELLRPLITHHIARRFKALEPDSPIQILYPHQKAGGRRIAANLQEFPRTARYLNRHRSTLGKRRYVLEGGRKWYEIWVPQDPDVWKQPKIVFKDISERPTFWMDFGGSVVNGDCYWITCDLQKADLLWLALAVGNSSFIEVFYDRRFHNKLYSGRRRFMTQYVETFPVPDPTTKVSKRMMLLAKRIYELIPERNTEHLEKELDQLVWQAFGLRIEEVTR